MLDHVDLVMWTKNGSHTLPRVLERINEVIPVRLVRLRLIVDDNSSDSTKEIAESYDWSVLSNEGRGISDGANTALHHVISPYFISFEQDLVLAEDWFEKVPPLLEEKNVAAASGLRIPDQPTELKKLQEYSAELYRRRGSLLYGKTIDNTLYRTEVLREIGGFPKLRVSAGVDNILAKKLYDNGYLWKVNYDVRSTHVRKNVVDELKHYYWYGTCQKGLNEQLEEFGDQVATILLRTVLSPLRGVQVAYKKHCWRIICLYPALRLSSFLGVLKGYFFDF